MTSIKKKFFITLGSVALIETVAVGIFFVLLYWFIWPLANDFLAVQREIAGVERQVRDFETLVEPGLQRNVDDIEALRSSFFVYSSERSLEFIELLERGAKRNNLVPDIGEFQSGTAPTEMRVVGSFINVMKFLREFENGSTLFQISGLTMTTAEGGTVSAAIQFKLAQL